MAFDPRTGRCANCEAAASAAYGQFRQLFRQIVADDKITHEEWSYLQSEAQRLGVPWELGLDHVMPDTLAFIERSLTFAAGDGCIDPKEQRGILSMLETLRVPAEQAKRIRTRIEYINSLDALTKGQLPWLAPGPNVVLEPNETLHLQTQASRVKAGKHGPRSSDGTLIVTSLRLQFLEPQDGTTITWRSVLRVERAGHSIIVEGSGRDGDVKLWVEDSVYIEAVILAALKRFKELHQAPAFGAAPAQVPNSVRIEVWKRDAGQCVQCGSSEYLEFDHQVSPGRGGSSTPDNVMLLCRRCSLEKGDRR